MTHALFEISWEVCNKVGGIHTVLSSKAKTAVERYGDDYVTTMAECKNWHIDTKTIAKFGSHNVTFRMFFKMRI